MPNHVKTVCTVEGPEKDVAAFVIAHIRGDEDEKHFSLDSVIPMPQSIKDTIRGRDDLMAGYGDAHVELRAKAALQNKSTFMLPHERYPWFPANVRTWANLIEWLDDKYPDAWKWAQRSLRAAAETGHDGWYEWSCETWGTKWDSYDYEWRAREDGRFVFSFDTAWAFPEPVFEALRAKWPTLTFTTATSDEGGPCYRGKFTAKAATFERVEESKALLVEVYGADHWRVTDEDEEVEATP